MKNVDPHYRKFRPGTQAPPFLILLTEILTTEKEEDF